MRAKTQVTKICEHCSKEFQIHAYRVKNGTGKFCSQVCYLSARWGKNQPCKQCGTPSEYRFCGDRCRKDYWNKNGFAEHKHPRNWQRKLELIDALGGKCVSCGEANHRVLDIDHIDPSMKLRDKGRTSVWSYRFRDWKANAGNLRLLCANCHRIHTWEQMGYGIHSKAA